MNEEARKAERARWDAQFYEDSTRGRAWAVWWKEHSHGEQHPDTWLPWNLFYAGFDSPRTFSAEDVERVAEAIHRARYPRSTHGEVYPASRAWARAALSAIGTVEEAQ